MQRPSPHEGEVAGHAFGSRPRRPPGRRRRAWRAEGLVVLADALLGELHAEDVPARRSARRRDSCLLGRDAQEVVDVVSLPSLTNSVWPPKREPVGEDHALGVGGELDLGQDLVTTRRGCWRPSAPAPRWCPGSRCTARSAAPASGTRSLKLRLDALRSLSGSTLFFSASSHQRPQLLDLVGVLVGEVVGLGAVLVGVEQLPAVVVEVAQAGRSGRARRRPSSPGARCRGCPSSRSTGSPSAVGAVGRVEGVAHRHARERGLRRRRRRPPASRRRSTSRMVGTMSVAVVVLVAHLALGPDALPASGSPAGRRPRPGRCSA